MNKRIIKFVLLSTILFAGFHHRAEVKLAAPINLKELTVTQAHKAFKAGTYNSKKLVSAYLEQIERHNGTTNALTSINSNALAIAEALDKEYMITGVLRPLHGIPIIVKDNFNTKGLLTTGGSNALKDFIADDDAFMVRKMLDAGAIIIAKSNMAEWAFSPKHTKSSTAGTTKNPYNLDYVPAGSSGGTAAAIASNMGLLGLGTDTGNSIRGPSSHNALVGFRSTLGLTSRSGIIPLYLRNDVAGPMCRTVEDATRVLEIIAGYDPKDPLTKYSIGNIPKNYMQFLKKDGLKGKRIGVLTELSENNPDPEIKALFATALKDLKTLGAIVVERVDVDDFNNLRQNQWCSEFRKDIEDYLKEYVKKDSLRTLEDIIKIGSISEDVVKNLNYFTKNSGREKNPEIECADPYNDKRRIAFRNAIVTRMDELKLDAIVYPTWNNKPAKIANFKEDYKGDNNQVVAPHTGQPAFTVPMGFARENLPAGLQFLGRMYSEPMLIQMAYAYEQGTKHRIPPPMK